MRANKIKKDEELWSKIRDLIRPSTENSSEEYIKIKFNLDDRLALNKTIEIPSMIIVVRVVFHENKFVKITNYRLERKKSKGFYNVLTGIRYNLLLSDQIKRKTKAPFTILRQK